MNDEQLNDALRAAPEPDSSAKKRALNLAMAEFQAVQREQAADKNSAAEKNNAFLQGFWSWLRPTANNHQSRNANMKFAQKKLLVTSMATCSLALVGLVVFNHYPIPGTHWSDSPTRTEHQINNQHGTTNTQSPAPTAPTELEEIVVSGARENIAISEEKYGAEATVDTLAVNDADALPDSSTAEALPRQPGIAVNKITSNPAAPSATPIKEAEAYDRQQAIAYEQKAKQQADTSRKKADSRAEKNGLMALSKPMATGMVMTELVTDQVAPPTTEYDDRFEKVKENSVKAVTVEPVSTFSIDVDTASYSFVRRSLNAGHLPPKDAVRTEELINYFDYLYPQPSNKKTPFKANVVVVDSPWKAGNKLIHIGIKGYQIPASEIPRSNLVFLLDVSGSMSSPDKLPLVQQSMELLLDNLKPDDTVAIVVYAGAAGTVLEPTKAKEKQKILSAIQQLNAGGSTAGAEGIQLAYQLAEANFDPKAVNRIILTTDGDFNVGPTGDSDLKTLVERKRDKGIYLSVLGFGQGNYQDAMMQTLAQNGNGVAAYIDTLSEAQKVLVHEATSTLFPIASDVKIQMEFNPAKVAEYRLIGYETRALKREDFSNDKVDAGDIGAGHTVTAIYEITPVGAGSGLLEPSRYQTDKKLEKAAKMTHEYGFLRIRYKLPGEKTSQLIEQPISDKLGFSLEQKIPAGSLQQEAGFATAVAGFAQLLRTSNFVGDYTYDKVIELAQKTKGDDEFGYRTEFIQLVRKAKMAKEL